MNRIDITKYEPKHSDIFFFDNNIWMYLYCPIGSYNSNIVDKYSTFYGKVISAGSRIMVSSMVLSEFYNSYLRLDFNIWKGQLSKDFKRDYRGCARFKETSAIIINSIESRILGVASKVDDNFSALDIDDIFANCTSLDFNDSCYIEFAKRNNCMIVTNDKDFILVSDNIDIITT